MNNQQTAPTKRKGRRLRDHLACLVIDGVSDYAIFALDREGRISSWSAGAARITGHEADEIIGRPYSILLPATESDWKADLEAATETGPRETQGWRVRKDSGRYWAREVISSVQDESGRPIAFAVLLRDETAQRRAELTRQRSEEMFAGIVKLSADAIVTVNESQQIVLFNRAAERIFGYPAEEVIGQPLELLLPEGLSGTYPHRGREDAAPSVRSRRMGKRKETQLWALRSTGEIFPIEASISRNSVGGEVCLTWMIRDISERVRQEEARDLLARVSVVLDASLDYETTLRDLARLVVPDLAHWCVVYLAGKDGTVRRLEVAHADPALEDVLGELKNYEISRDSLHPALQVIESGEPRLISPVPVDLIEAIAQDDHYLDIIREVGLRSAVIVPLSARGQIFGALGLFRGISAQPYEEFDCWLAREVGGRAGLAIDNARLYGAAQRAVRARDEVVSVVSHDLRNPLNTIVMSSEMALLQMAEGEDREVIAESLHMIRHSADRMNRMVEDLLDITRLESGRFVLERQPVEISSVLYEASESFAPLAREKGLKLTLQIPSTLPRADADVERLHQILSNLVGNALKFTPQGEITISARRGSDSIVVAVADTGIGIPAEHLPSLFDRFWQAQRADRRGLGVGLAIVKGIVEAHGGEVWVESEEGVGTTFSFSLPAGLAVPRSAGSQERSPTLRIGVSPPAQVGSVGDESPVRTVDEMLPVPDIG